MLERHVATSDERGGSALTHHLPLVIVPGRMANLPLPRATVSDPATAVGAGPSSAEPLPVADELAVFAHAAAAGDPDAAATLVLRLGGGILRIVRKVFGSRHPDLEDIAQEAAMAVLGALPRFRGESSVMHFAYRVTLLTALGARRKMRAQIRRAEEEAGPLDDVQAPKEASPYFETLARKRRELVVELLDELSDPIAEALALHFMLGHSVEDIATSLGLSQHTVWSRLRLGKQALRRKLQRNACLREMLGVPE